MIKKIINIFSRKDKIEDFSTKIKKTDKAPKLKLGKIRIGLKWNFFKSSQLSSKFSPNALWSIVYFQGFLLLTLIGGGIWAYYTYFMGPSVDKTIPQYPTYVEAAPVEVGTFETFVTTMGTLKANESIVIRPEVEGKVKSIKFQSGDKVKKGDILIELDDTVYKAVEKEAVAKVLLWKGKFERAEKLYERKAGTLKEKEENFAQLKMAEADFDRAYSQRQKTIIRAPFEGTIGFKDISVGAYVRPGEDLVTLDDLDPVKVDFRVGENMIDRIKIGQKVELVVEGLLDSQFEATIEAIDPNVDSVGHNIRARAVLENKDELFKPGLFAKVKMLDSSHADVIMVPESAIESRGNRESVYIIENGVATNVPVKAGNRNGEKVEILGGLTPGQVVVTAGQMRLRDKTNVIIVPPNSYKKLM